MKHFVLFKFEEGYLSDALIENARTVYAKLKETLPEHILAASVHVNCVVRDTNCYDLMVELELAEKASLDVYLTHPIHVQLGKEWLPHISDRCSFDYLL